MSSTPPGPSGPDPIRPDPTRPETPRASTGARLWALLGVLAALVGGVTIVATLTDDEGKPRPTITVTVGKPKSEAAVCSAVPGSAADTAARPPSTDCVEAEDVKVAVPKAAVRAARDVGDHEELKSEDPAGASREDLEAARAQQEQLAQSDALPIVTPLAAPSQRGCTTRLVGNFSSRRGVRPRLLVVHYTVSANRPGWGDVFAIVSLFDRPSFAASSSYVIDDEAHCAYIVRESDKPWTQAAANPVSISVEVIATGREGRLSSSAGIAKIGRVFADAGKRWAIPMQQGKVSGCTVVRAGIIDHHSLGPCGGGHVDVSPYSLSPVIIAARKAAGASPVAASKAPASIRAWCSRSRSSDAKANATRLRLVRRHGWDCKGATPVRHKITRVDRSTCAKLRAWRKAGRPAGELKTNVRRRQALEARGVFCGSRSLHVVK